MRESYQILLYSCEAFAPRPIFADGTAWKAPKTSQPRKRLKKIMIYHTFGTRREQRLELLDLDATGFAASLVGLGCPHFCNECWNPLPDIDFPSGEVAILSPLSQRRRRIVVSESFVTFEMVVAFETLRSSCGTSPSSSRSTVLFNSQNSPNSSPRHRYLSKMV